MFDDSPKTQAKHKSTRKVILKNRNINSFPYFYESVYLTSPFLFENNEILGLVLFYLKESPSLDRQSSGNRYLFLLYVCISIDAHVVYKTQGVHK